jgi:hypothetical protein
MSTDSQLAGNGWLWAEFNPDGTVGYSITHTELAAPAVIRSSAVHRMTSRERSSVNTNVLTVDDPSNSAKCEMTRDEQ